MTSAVQSSFLTSSTKKYEAFIKVFVHHHFSLDCQVVIMLNPKPCWVYLEMPSIIAQFIEQKWSVTLLLTVPNPKEKKTD